MEASDQNTEVRNWDRVAVSLTYRDVVEILYFIYQNGYLSYKYHEHIHELNFNLEVLMDNFVPGWQVADLEKLVKEASKEVGPLQ